MKGLEVGQPAPELNVPNQNGELKSIGDYKGKKLILFFYPKDNTPGCTLEACSLRDNYDDLLKDGFEVVGVSADSEKKHQNFIRKFNFPFDLLADTEKKVINAYKVWGEKKFMGRTFDGIFRTTFIINENGIIEQIIDKVKTKNHAAQIRQAMEAQV